MTAFPRAHVIVLCIESVYKPGACASMHIAQEMLPELVCASVVSTIGAALDAHVRQARERGWAQPQQLLRITDKGPRQPLQVRILPYQELVGCLLALLSRPI